MKILDLLEFKKIEQTAVEFLESFEFFCLSDSHLSAQPQCTSRYTNVPNSRENSEMENDTCMAVLKEEMLSNAIYSGH